MDQCQNQKTTDSAQTIRIGHCSWMQVRKVKNYWRAQNNDEKAKPSWVFKEQEVKIDLEKEERRRIKKRKGESWEGKNQKTMLRVRA